MRFQIRLKAEWTGTQRSLPIEALVMTVDNDTLMENPGTIVYRTAVIHVQTWRLANTCEKGKHMVCFLGESKNGFVISDHTDSSLQKTEDPKKDHLPWQRHVLVLLVEKKQQQQTDPHGEDKKKKQRTLRMNVRNVYTSLWDTNVSRIEYTP